MDSDFKVCFVCIRGEKIWIGYRVKGNIARISEPMIIPEPPYTKDDPPVWDLRSIWD